MGRFRLMPEKVEIVKKALQRCGWTQVVLLERAGIGSRSTLQRFLNGQPVDLATFVSFSEALNLNWEDLAGIKPVPPPSNLERSGAIEFVGREEVMETLHKLLDIEGKVAITAIAGMAGVGKTELALQYGHRYLNELTYPGGVCWFRVRDSDAATTDLGIQIIDFVQTQLGLTVPKKSEDIIWSLEQRVDWCWRNWQPTDKRTLLILDDVPSYESIQAFIPADRNRFKILITTRIQDLGGATYTILIEPLQPNAALQLLKTIVGASRIEAELEQAQTLCQWLEYLPLGLELVGRYLRRKKDLSLEEMHQRLEEKRLKEHSLYADSFQPQKLGMTAKRNLIAAFDLSWQELDEDTRQLTYLLGLFAAEPIPWSLVEECLPGQDTATIENIRDDKLIDLSLLKRKGKGIYVLHRLIRDFFRLRLEEVPNSNILKRDYCHIMSRKAFLETSDNIHFDPQTWSLLVPHIEEAAENLNEYLSDQDLLHPFHILSLYNKSQGAYETGLFHSKNALEGI